MTIQRLYLPEHSFALTLVSGKVTNAEVGEHIMTMNHDFADKEGIIELADCRYVTDTTEVDGSSLAFIASLEEGQPRNRGGKGAIVATCNETFGLASAFASVAKNIDVVSRVCRDIEEAIEWLGVHHLKDEILSHTEGVKS